MRSGEREVGREAVLERGLRAASGLAALGVGRGDVLAICLRNDIAYFEATVAAAALGAFATPINWHGSGDEVGYVVRDSAAKALVIHADLLARVAADLPEQTKVFVVETPPEIAQAYGVSEADARAPAGAALWNDWIGAFPPRLDPAPAGPGAMIYTSGTTGRPKGVKREGQAEALRAAHLMAVGEAWGYLEWLAQPGVMKTAVCGPLYHSAPNGYTTTLFYLGANILLQPRFDPEGLLADIERHGITHLHMVPTMFVRLLKLPAEVRARYDLSSLRHVVHAAAPCPPHVKRAMIDWWGPIINEYYGGTEIGVATYCTSEEWLAHPGTVGRPLASAEVRVIDGEGRSLPSGSVGEIVCRLNTMADFTYHGDDAKRRATEKAGLIALGDVGYLDQDGFLYLCDRVKDMIISGGVNIYPAEIEAELHKMPGVADCAVFGVPDEEFGEQVCAFVQPQPGQVLASAEVQAFLKPRIAGYKIPRRIEFHNDLPREDSGKIFKRKLREPFWSAIGRNI